MTKKFQIFVSSTYTDLIEERQAAVEAILRCGHIPAGMELFSAGDEAQIEVIKRWIDESDIYVLILGGRYGSIEKKSGLSYTELEFLYAVETKKPFFAIVLNEGFIDEKLRKGGINFIERHASEKLTRFRNSVLNQMCKLVDDTKDIKLAITNSIIDLQKRYSLVGWVRDTSLSSLATETTSSGRTQTVSKPKFELMDSFPKDGKPISLSEIGQMFLKFSNPLDRSTACFIGLLNIRENCFYQWDSSGGIYYFEENTKVVYRMAESVKSREPAILEADHEFYRFEIHIGRGHPDTLVKDIYGSVLNHTIIRLFIKED